MSDEQAAELKGCLSCGGKVIRDFVTTDVYSVIACTECDATYDWTDEEWNTHPIEAAKDARIAALEAEIADGWRVSLALAYSGAKLYTDDGELSDGSASPAIDFRRDSYAEIKAKIQQRGLNWLNEHREEAEAIMSAPQQIAALEAKCERMAKCIKAADKIAATRPGDWTNRGEQLWLLDQYKAARAAVEEGES